jgi:hypothetical protein
MYGEFDMTVTDSERAAMARLLQIMKGHTVSPSTQPLNEHVHATQPVELPGAGQVTARDVQAMAQVLHKFNQAVNDTHRELVRESVHDAHTAEALITERDADHVRVGPYRIAVKLDEARTAGKQYYDVIHSATGEKLAHELSLYEAAHGLVRLLNSGRYVNHPQVRELLEAEATYTHHRIDAIRYHRMIQTAHKQNQLQKLPVYEARKAASMDHAAQAKARVKKLYRAL